MKNLRIWASAFYGIPRISREDWQHLDLFGRWLIATRVAVLVMTLLSVCIAGLFAVQHGLFRWDRFLMVVVGLLSAHATNNILNDVSDHLRGVDKDNAFRTQYGMQPIEEGMLSVSQARRWALCTVLPMLITASYLTYTVGIALLPFVIVGVVLVFAYNWPLKHYGLGEPTVILVWGPLMVCGGYMSIAGVWAWDVFWASFPYAIGPTIVLFGKHIDKIPWDSKRGVHTLPVLLGHKKARNSVLLLLGMQLVMIPLLVWYGVLHVYSLIAFLGASFVYKMLLVYAKPTPKEPPQEYPPNVWPLWYSAHAFVHCRRFGVAYMLALVAHVFHEEIQHWIF